MCTRIPYHFTVDWNFQCNSIFSLETHTHTHMIQDDSRQYQVCRCRCMYMYIQTICSYCMLSRVYHLLCRGNTLHSISLKRFIPQLNIWFWFALLSVDLMAVCLCVCKYFIQSLFFSFFLFFSKSVSYLYHLIVISIARVISNEIYSMRRIVHAHTQTKTNINIRHGVFITSYTLYSLSTRFLVNDIIIFLQFFKSSTQSRSKERAKERKKWWRTQTYTYILTG